MTSHLREELFLLLCSLPLMVMDLRLRTDPVVTASDASEDGCGVCKTVHLKADGVKVLRSMGNLKSAVNEDIGLIELYAGLGGARQALWLALTLVFMCWLRQITKLRERPAWHGLVRSGGPMCWM